MSAVHDRKLRDAVAALAAGEWARADLLSRQVLERAPRHPRALQVAAAVCLQRGDGAKAGEHLLRALAGDPDNPELLEGLGAAALKAGSFAEAETWLRRAMELGSAGTATLIWLGLALSSQGRHTEAVEIFRQVAAAAPRDPRVQLNLAHALTRTGAWKEAVAAYERALEFKPDDAEVQDNLGAAFLQLGKWQEAAECFRRAIRFAPANADYHADLGHALLEQQLWDGAVASYRDALTFRPDYPEVLNSLGSALQGCGKPEEAIAPLREAIRLRPDYAEAHDNLGGAFARMGRKIEADASHRRAISLQPVEPERLVRYANALAEQYRLDDAIAQYMRALQLDPAFADAQYGLAVARLFRQEFEVAWPLYEGRLNVRNFRNRNFRSAPESAILYDSLPHWRGPAETVAGTVAIWAEQGIGDQVLFSTLIPELIATGISFLYELDPRLLAAYRRAFPGLRFVEKGDPPREAVQRADRVLALGSLPGLFRRSREDFARQPVRLLSALPERVAHYRRRLDAQGKGRKVAFSWKSTRKDWLALKKSVPLLDFAPLLRLPGTLFVDVQYGDTAAERKTVESEVGVRLVRFETVDYFNDLEEVLAILEACDLLITTSNATAHFAGALGKRTWLLYLADQAPFHYWAHGGSYRCLWYPSVEIVTAPHVTDWVSLIEHVKDRLTRELVPPAPGFDGSPPAASKR